MVMLKLYNDSYKDQKHMRGVVFGSADKEKVLYHNLVASANDEIGVSLARIATALEKLAGIDFKGENSGVSQ